MNNKDKYDLYKEIIYDVLFNPDYRKEDGDILLDGLSECLQPWFQWRAHKEYNEKQMVCQATFYIIVVGNTFEVTVIECSDGYDFEYSFNIPMGLSKEETSKRFIEEMEIANDKWDEYCNEIDAEQE